jgi:hypothetical protein
MKHHHVVSLSPMHLWTAIGETERRTAWRGDGGAKPLAIGRVHGAQSLCV